MLVRGLRRKCALKDSSLCFTIYVLRKREEKSSTSSSVSYNIPSTYMKENAKINLSSRVKKNTKEEQNNQLAIDVMEESS